MWQRIIPTVERRWLYLAAAILWSAAGTMLCARAGGWLVAEDTRQALLHLAIGTMAGVLIYRFKFSRIAARNVQRIRRLPERNNLLAFQPPLMYVLISLMMSLGVALRHSAIPRPALAILYLGIGLGLVLASLSYYYCVWLPARPQPAASDSGR